MTQWYFSTIHLNPLIKLIAQDYDHFIVRSFKTILFAAQRKEEALGIRAKFPQKVPVIVERYHKEKSLPALDKTKFLVPQEITMSQFVTIIR